MSMTTLSIYRIRVASKVPECGCLLIVGRPFLFIHFEQSIKYWFSL